MSNQEPTSAAEIVEDYLHKIRSQFYPDDFKKFAQQRAMLIKGITHLASWLKMRGTRLPDRRYRQILDDIINDIKRHGQTGKIQYFCRYFLHVVQTHVQHHDEEYYAEAKSLRNALDRFTGDLTKKQANQVIEAQDDTTDRLAEIHRAISTKARRRPKKTDTQMSFL